MKFYSIDPEGRIAAGVRTRGAMRLAFHAEAMKYQALLLQGRLAGVWYFVVANSQGRILIHKVLASGPPRPLSAEYQPWSLF